MSTTTETIRNGVDTAQLFGTLDAIRAQPTLATFQFRARNRWLGGSHNRTTIRQFFGAGQENRHVSPFEADNSEPPPVRDVKADIFHGGDFARGPAVVAPQQDVDEGLLDRAVLRRVQPEPQGDVIQSDEILGHGRPLQTEDQRILVPLEDQHADEQCRQTDRHRPGQFRRRGQPSVVDRAVKHLDD